jgi:hypothetical protein
LAVYAKSKELQQRHQELLTLDKELEQLERSKAQSQRMADNLKRQQLLLQIEKTKSEYEKKQKEVCPYVSIIRLPPTPIFLSIPAAALQAHDYDDFPSGDAGAHPEFFETTTSPFAPASLSKPSPGPAPDPATGSPSQPHLSSPQLYE